jgi:hypothetical protein
MVEHFAIPPHVDRYPKITTEGWCGITTHHITSTRVEWLQPAPISGGEGPSSVVIQGAKEGTKADKKRRKQRHQEATTNVDGGINDRAGGSSAEHATKSVSNIKRQVQPPKDHFEKPLAETCLNHAYTIKYKLRDCSLMKSFMTTGSLSRGMEVDEGPIEGDAMPFLREDVVMMIFGRHPSLEKRRGLDPSTQTPSHSNQGWGGHGNVRAWFFIVH